MWLKNILRSKAEETVSRAEYDRLEIAFNKMMTERNELRPDAEKYRASIARLHAANARRKAQARDKQQAGEVAHG